MKDPRNPIVRPVTRDGLVGYTAKGDFVVFAKRVEDDEPVIYSSNNTRDVSGEMCLLCGKVWSGADDVAHFLDQLWNNEVMGNLHRSCYERHLGFLEREKWVESLVIAGFDRASIQSMQQIPNEYRGAWNTPWYVIELKGVKRKNPEVPVMLKFGSRKRVYNIEISGTESNGPALLKKRFEAEDTTKGTETSEGNFYIHAWGFDKAKEYLTGIVASLKEMEATLHEIATSN